MTDSVQDFPSDKNEIFGDYSFSDSFFENPSGVDQSKKFLNNIQPITNSYFRTTYTIPLEDVRKHVSYAEKVIFETKKMIEDSLLRKIYIDPYVDPDLEQAHFRVWDEASRYLSQVTIDTTELTSPPDYICFDQYIFAEKISSTAGRRLIEEYREAVSHSTFSYLFNFRKILTLLMSELSCIKKSLLSDFGGGYENESQQKVASQYYSWCKMATDYAQRIKKTIATVPRKVPVSEVDKVTKSQAAKFQTFFALKLNAVDSEIGNILSSLQRDMVDNCDVFYDNFLRPSIRLNKDVASPLEIERETTAYDEMFPTLAREVYVASNFIKGNFVSVQADMLERFSMFMEKMNMVIMLVHEKRKYSNFLSQLSYKAVKKKTVLKNVQEDKYSIFFKNITVNTNRNDTYKSSHSDLDNLDSNDHPQYLLRSGGVVTGNITTEDNVTIDGVDIGSHAHTGVDGSARISIKDIDFDSIRDPDDRNNYAVKPLSVRVITFIPDVIEGGVPVFDTVIGITVDDSITEDYEYEINYIEIS